MKYYFIIPVILMVAFVFIERGASKQADARTQAIAAEKAKEEEKKLADKKKLEEKARIDSEKRNAERVAEEARLKEKKQKEFDDKIQKLKDDAKKYQDDVDKANVLVATLEKDLAAKRAQRDSENRTVLDLAKKVEITKKARRSAELEVQRYTEMLTAKANESAMAKMPVVPTGATAAK